MAEAKKPSDVFARIFNTGGRGQGKAPPSAYYSDLFKQHQQGGTVTGRISGKNPSKIISIDYAAEYKKTLANASIVIFSHKHNDGPRARLLKTLEATKYVLMNRIKHSERRTYMLASRKTIETARNMLVYDLTFRDLNKDNQDTLKECVDELNVLLEVPDLHSFKVRRYDN